MTTRVDRPIFVIGTGRSGTTLLYGLLGFHPDLGWFSNFDQRFPDWPLVAALARVHRLPGARFLDRRSRYVPRPLESYATLDRCTAGLFSAHRDLAAADATPEIAARFRARVARQLALQGRPRFAAKYTGLPRIGFVDAIFPDARFVEVARDPRAVAASLLRMSWWSERLEGWRYGPAAPEHEAEYEASGRAPAVLAAIAAKHLRARHDEAAARIGPARHRRVEYDALVWDPVGVLRTLCAFCELEWRPDFERHVRAWPVTRRADDWGSRLKPGERSAIDRSLSA